MRPPTWQIVTADVRDGLRMLPDESFQCAVTSPPYWSQRAYGTAPQVWGGDPACAHQWGALAAPAGSSFEGSPDGTDGVFERRASRLTGVERVGSSTCERCGAWRGELGAEPDPSLWVDHLVGIFREVRRVLRPDGTLWVNCGDSYNSYNGNRGASASISSHSDAGRPQMPGGRGLSCPTLKHKDLVGLAWMLAFALRDDGWWLRAANVWAKRSCLPESVTDRPAVCHEYVFLLTKSERYFYDTEAVRVQSVGRNHHDLTGGNYAPPGQSTHTGSRNGKAPIGGRNLRTVWEDEIDVEGEPGAADVWWVNPQAMPARHFATYPEKLVEPCIRAGTSAGGCCPLCGAPHRRVVADRGPDATRQASAGADASGGYTGASTKAHEQAGVQDASAVKARVLAGMRRKETVGWSPTCEHNDLAPVPCAVLDPFSGAGTTGVVALREGRDYIGLELNPEYAAMAEARISDPDWIKKQRARVRAERDAEGSDA